MERDFLRLSYAVPKMYIQHPLPTEAHYCGNQEPFSFLTENLFKICQNTKLLNRQPRFHQTGGKFPILTNGTMDKWKMVKNGTLVACQIITKFSSARGEDSSSYLEQLCCISCILKRQNPSASSRAYMYNLIFMEMKSKLFIEGSKVAFFILS